MRQILFLLIILFGFYSAGAQRFYYVETNNLVDRLLKTRLEKSEQYVTASAMESEYTVRTIVKGGDDARELNLEIVLADSVTQKEIFRTSHQFCFGTGNVQPELLYSLAIGSFLKRSLGEMMQTAAEDHGGLFRHELRARKDKS